MTIDVLRYGELGLLVELPETRDVLGFAVAADALDGVVEVVPGARTVLITVADAGTIPTISSMLREVTPSGAADAVDTEPVVFDVAYDGPDLADTATEVGLDVDGLVRAHTEAEYVVAFCGFAPGFGYLAGLPESLHVPRLDEPRTAVPAGSVAIAGEYSAVYPRSSPGGWRLLGRTDAPLWDTDRNPPALLAPGVRVRFHSVR